MTSTLIYPTTTAPTPTATPTAATTAPTTDLTPTRERVAHGF